MKILLPSVLVFGVLISSFGQQQSPFVTPRPTQPPATPPPAPAPTTPQPGEPRNSAITGQTPTGAFGQIPTNATARSAFGQPGAEATAQTQAQAGTAPLFLNVAGTTVFDATGQPVGTVQQIVLSPSGTINLAVVSMGGRLVPVPWQLIGTSTVPGRSGLVINSDRQLLQQAPPVFMGNLPALTQEAALQQIFDHFALSPPNQTTTIDTTAQGRPGRGAGVTLTGGATNTVAGTATTTNQAVNTTSGLLSPTGRTNAAFDGYNSGPGSTDRLGPRQNGNAPPPPNSANPIPPPNPAPPAPAPPDSTRRP